MGKRGVRKPLTIAVDPNWLMHPEVQKLRTQGHRVVPLEQRADLILAPEAHYFHLAWMTETGLKLALARAKARQVVS